LWKEDIAVAGGLIIVCRDCFVVATILGVRRLRFLAVEIPICRAIVVFYIVLLYSCVEVSSPRNVNAQLDEYWKEQQEEIPGTLHTSTTVYGVTVPVVSKNEWIVCAQYGEEQGF